MLNIEVFYITKVPSGRFSFVGKIPTKICTKQKASKSDLVGGRWFLENGEYLSWKMPSFETLEEAIEHCKACDVEYSL